MPETIDVGLEIEPARHRHVDAVGGRAVHVQEAVGGAAQLSGRSRVRELEAPLRSRSGATTVISPRAARPFGERGQSGGEIAVVVREEDAHFL